MEHSPTSATGTAWEPTQWRATQRAAWEALRRSDDMSTWTKIALTLTILGTIGVGVIPMIGRASLRRGLGFRSAGWRSSWLVAWIVFLIGVALIADVR